MKFETKPIFAAMVGMLRTLYTDLLVSLFVCPFTIVIQYLTLLLEFSHEKTFLDCPLASPSRALAARATLIDIVVVVEYEVCRPYQSTARLSTTLSHSHI